MPILTKVFPGKQIKGCDPVILSLCGYSFFVHLSPIKATTWFFVHDVYGNRNMAMSILTRQIFVALIATVASLAWGTVSMAEGSNQDVDHSAKLMNGRVLLQGSGLLLLTALFA